MTEQISTSTANWTLPPEALIRGLVESLSGDEDQSSWLDGIPSARIRR